MPRPSCAASSLVSQRDADDTVRAFTGVQIPGVLDDLYADAVADADLGVTFSKDKPTFRLWAPTAQTATLLTWNRRALKANPCVTRRRGTRHPESGPSRAGRR